MSSSVGRQSSRTGRSPIVRTSTSASRQAAKKNLLRSGMIMQKSRAISTPRTISYWRFVLAISCVIAAVVIPMTLGRNRQSVEDSNQAVQQILRLAEVRSSLFGAEIAASQDLLDRSASQPESPSGQTSEERTDKQADPTSRQGESDYQASLDSASEVLIDAASSDNADTGALRVINSSAGRYASLLSLAVTTGSADDIAAAKDQLSTELSPLLDAQIDQQMYVLERNQARQYWLIPLLAVPILLLLVGSIIIANRTRRILNLGLLVAFIVTAISMGSVATLVVRGAADLSSAKSGSATQATTIASSYYGLSELEAAEARQLLGVITFSQGEELYQGIVQSTSEEFAQLESSSMQADLSKMTEAHAQIASSLTAGKDVNSISWQKRKEIFQQTHSQYSSMISSLNDEAEALNNSASEQFSGYARSIKQVAWIASGALVIAAISSLLGLTGALRRYQ